MIVRIQGNSYALQYVIIQKICFLQLKSNKLHIFHVLSFKLAPLSATLYVCPGHPARTGRCFMPHGQGEHATCHHASAVDVIARVVNIKPSSDNIGWWTGFSGGPDFRAVIFYVWHTEYHGRQSPMWSFVT